MRLFRNSEVLNTDDLCAMAQYQGMYGPTRFHAAPEAPVRAWVSNVRRAGVDCFSTEVVGPFAREALNGGMDVAVGLVLKGQVHISTFDELFTAGPGDAVWTFPGDYFIQASRNIVVATIRTTIGDEALFRLRALPFRARIGLRRHAASCDAPHLFRLLNFLSEEYERIGAECSSVASAYLDGLARGLADLVRNMMPLPPRLKSCDDPESIRVCVSADAVLRRNPAQRLLSRELAEQSMCSERQLFRSFERVGGVSPAAYAGRIRLIAARNELMLGPGNERLSTGSAEPEPLMQDRRFRSLYQKEFGETPEQTRERCLRLRDQALHAVFGRGEGLLHTR